MRARLARLARLARFPSPSVLSKSTSYGRCLQRQRLGVEAALAAPVERLGVALPQLRLPGIAREFLDAQWKAIEIKQEFAIAQESSARHLRIARHKMPARTPRRIPARERQYIGPVIKLQLITVHQFHLPIMNCLAAGIQRGARQELKPQIFGAAHVRHGGALARCLLNRPLA